MASLREEGAEEEMIRWGEANLRKAKAKVAEKEEAIEGFNRAVRRSKREFAAVVARVKDEEVDEVVEVDVEGEMEEGIVKEEEETKVVMAAQAAGGVSQWLRGLMGSRDAGAGWAWGGVEWVGKAWVWTPTWSALLDFGGFNSEAANRGVYAGVVHGIASRPKSKPNPAATPARAPPQLHPPNPADAFAKALGAISPALDRQGTVCCLRSSVDLANRSSVDLASAVPPPLESRPNAARTVA